MSSIERFRRRTQRSGADKKEIAINEARRNFNKVLRENPTAVKVQATVPDEFCVTEETRYLDALITDVALNDQRALDEKYFHVSVDTDITTGCYVRYRNKNWLVYFEEVNGFDTHKTYIIKRCNQVFRFMHEGKIHDIPVSVTNLTLYSDGLAEGVYISKADSKRNVKFGSNPITRLVDLGHRCMLTNKTVFKVTHIDDFTQNGVIGCIILQTAIIPEDDLEGNVAFNPSQDVEEEPEEDVNRKSLLNTLHIEGSDSIYLGSEESYSSNILNTSWSLDEGERAITITNTENGVCSISATSNSNYVNYKTRIYARVGDEMAQKEIVIKNYF